MKIILILFIFIIDLLASQYSIIAFSTKNYDEKMAKKFISRFPNGIVKQYSKFVEYKIEPFKNYKEAQKFLPNVKKYYKYPLIIKYNLNLGKVLYKGDYEVVSNNYKPLLSHIKNNTNSYNHSWEINNTEVLKDINISVKDYLKDVSVNVNILPKKVNKLQNINECNLTGSDYNFYIDIYANKYDAQKDKTKLYGDKENLKLGFIYYKYFWNRWKFYTDDRIILKRDNKNGNKNYNSYLDVNELYIRNYCYQTNFLLGRKKTKDYRSWWYDEYLDEVSLFNENNLLTYNLILATRINNLTNDEDSKSNLKDYKYLIAHLNYEYYYQQNLGLFYLYENGLENDNNFLGIRLYNDWYWIDLGIHKGYGFDIGLRHKYNNFIFAGSYAYGSENFKQPYIATNRSDYLNKNFSFRYYGEVLDPNLSNLQIFSLYGLYDFDMNSFILALHKYDQIKQKNTIYNGDYFYSSKSKDIGSELDILYQYLNNQNKLKLGLGMFIGGSAYDYLQQKQIYKLFLNYRYYFK